MQPQPNGTPPRRGIDRAVVREQLERMLADPLFKHSKRYPNLLRYVVERKLEDKAADLKERTLGVAVFGREPTYDTSNQSSRSRYGRRDPKAHRTVLSGAGSRARDPYPPLSGFVYP